MFHFRNYSRGFQPFLVGVPQHPIERWAEGEVSPIQQQNQKCHQLLRATATYPLGPSKVPPGWKPLNYTTTWKCCLGSLLFVDSFLQNFVDSVNLCKLVKFAWIRTTNSLVITELVFKLQSWNMLESRPNTNEIPTNVPQGNLDKYVSSAT